MGVRLPDPEGREFTGSATCRSCHSEAHSVWENSAHARAFRTLVEAGHDQDPDCVGCHVVGLGTKGGFESEAATPQLKDVGCESCHGGGQYYSARYVMKDPELSRLVGLVDPSEKGCRTCHDASSPSLKPFDFVTKLKAIDHWTVERNKRAAAEKGEKAEK